MFRLIFLLSFKIKKLRTKMSVALKKKKRVASKILFGKILKKSILKETDLLLKKKKRNLNSESDSVTNKEHDSL